MTCVFYSITDVRRKPNQLPQHWDCGNLRQYIPDFNTPRNLNMYSSTPEVQSNHPIH